MENIENALYLVATPIGNLADISYRAVHILNSVDLIAAEDTRTSSVLMNHYSIKTPLKSYHSHNIPSETPRLIEKLKSGNSIALISDAGTPGISDPGYHLVTECVNNNIAVSKKSILLTGSNMSGKTSFIRTIGLNVNGEESGGIPCLVSSPAPLSIVYKQVKKN